MTQRLEVATRRDVAFLLAACGWLLLTIWIRPLRLPDEGRYVGVAWEMVRSGDWLTPTLNGLPFFHKPPLFYWITGAALTLAGPVEWAGRVAPFFGAALSSISLYLLTLRWSSRAAAQQMLLVLCAQPLFYIGGQFANLDMLVAGCITACIALLADSVLSAQAGLPHRRSLLAGYALAGLGVLAKGLIGVVLPGAILVVWLVATRRPRFVVRLLSMPGLLIFCAIALPWFAVMQQRHPGFLDYFFVVQHFKRFAGGGFNNIQPAWFYPALLAVCFLPWLPWLWRVVRRDPLVATQHGLQSLMAVWAVLIVFFFSLPQSKPIGYVLPAVPPLAWLAAAGFRKAGGGARGWMAAAGFGALASLVAIATIGMRPTHSNKAMAQMLFDHRQAGEPVIMIQGYYYDVPFYARLANSAYVVDDWSDPGVARLDNWRKELADAARFSPGSAGAVLVDTKDLARLVCAAPRSWVIGAEDAKSVHRWLTQATLISTSQDIRLWRFELAGARSCESGKILGSEVDAATPAPPNHSP